MSLGTVGGQNCRLYVSGFVFCLVFLSLPLEFPWSCSHLSRSGSHTGWQAPQCEGSRGACWWLCCLSLSCLCPGHEREKRAVIFCFVLFCLHRGQALPVGQFNATHLFELVNDHGECLKDGSGRSCQGDDPLGAVALGDVDASPALRTQKWAEDLKNEAYVEKRAIKVKKKYMFKLIQK